jgi:serine/threonine-protein kinase RsbT
MSTADAGEAALAVLDRYFSASIARALLNVTRRREGLEGDPSGDATLGRTVDALERTLPSYMADPSRRRQCAAELRRLLPDRDPRVSLPPDSAGPTSPKAFAVTRPDHLHGATEAARSLGRSAGLGVLDQTKIATAVAEVTRNMLQYAGGGELWFSQISSPRRGLEVAAVDRGPGIPDVELVMSPRYRSRTGMGLGLKGVKRVVDELEIQSSRAGTRVVLRKYA